MCILIFLILTKFHVNNVYVALWGKMNSALCDLSNNISVKP